MLPRHLIASFAIPLALLLVGLAAPARAATMDQLVWRGDQATGRAIMDDLAKQYAKDKKGTIVLQPFSTLSGLDAVASGSADIAGSARGKYARRAEEANINFVPVALDAAVLITHPRNPVDRVTLKQVHDIYFGRITNWKELGGADLPINLYAIAAPLDGVEFSLRELVFRNGDQRVAAPRLYLNTVKLEEAVAIDPAGLGLSTLASVHGNKAVKALDIEGVKASPASVADASYPLYITLYLASRVDSPKQASIDRFLAFLDTPAAKDILRRHDLIPYADAGDAVARNEQRMAFIDAQLGRQASAVAAATPTPVSAPRATLESRVRIAPTAQTTEAARANLARAEEKKAAAKSAGAAPPPLPPAAPAAVASAPAPDAQMPRATVAPTPAPHVETRAPKAKVAATRKPAAKKKPAPKAVAKTAVAKTSKSPEPAKKPPVSFDNVNGGAAQN